MTSYNKSTYAKGHECEPKIISIPIGLTVVPLYSKTLSDGSDTSLGI